MITEYKADDRLQTVTETGAPCDERIPNIQTARKIYEKFKRAMWDTNARRARLKGMNDGNPPFNPATMGELGLLYITNVNFLEFRSILHQKAATSFELLFEVPTFIEVNPLIQDPSIPDPGYGNIIAEEFTRTLQKWSGFYFSMDKVRRETDLYGIGILVFRDEQDWRPKAFSTSCFLPDPMAELDIDTLSIYFLRDRLSAGDLYRQALINEKLAKDEGWNPKAVKRLLVQLYGEHAGTTSASSGYDQFQTSPAESAQQQLRLGQSFAPENEFQPVRIVHLCVKEVDDDKVSHYIFAEDILTGLDGEKDDGDIDTFLFKCTRRFDKVSQVLWWLPYNLGDGYVLSVRGLGSDIEPTCDLSNRFLGRTVDAGFTSASLLLQPSSEADMSKLQLVRMGMMTIIPSGLNLQQSTFQPQLNPLINLRDLLGSVMKNNTGVWKPHTENFAENIGQPVSARQVAEESSKEQRLERSNIVQDYVHYERLYREMFRRMTNSAYLKSKGNRPGAEEARQFVARCIARGVREELLLAQDYWEVTVYQAIGLGSPGVRLDITNQLMSVRGAMDEVGQRNVLRDYIAARAGQHNVDKYVARVNRNEVPSNETSIATLENNDFVEGSDLPVGNDQIHMIHIIKHLEPISEVVKAVLGSQGQGLNVDRAMNILAKGLVHVDAHLQYLAQDPSRADAVKQIKQVLQQAGQVYKFLMQQKQQQMKEQQAAQEQAQGGTTDQDGNMQLDPESMLKLKKLEMDMQIKQQDIAGQNQVRMAKAQGAAQIKQQAMSADLGLKAQRQAAEIEMESRKVDAMNAIKSAKASAT